MSFDLRISSKNRPVIVILGPTGVGKTGAAIRLAQSLGTEIISADSMQIYRHMDIGTAKPSQAELSLVRHHMIDILEPSETFSAGRYVETVVPVIERLLSQEKVPVIVGGTGLYIRAMTRGIFSGPAADWGLRDELLAGEEEQPGSLYARLSGLDPAAAARIRPADTRRIIRAIEVCLTAGAGISELQETGTRPLNYSFIKIGLTRQRTELYRLIEERVDKMFTAGLVEEVRHLPGLEPGKTALQAIGYKEVIAHLRGEYSLDEAIRLIKKRSKNYAKRQFTWFRRESGILWADVTGRYGPEDLGRAIEIFLKMD